MYCLGIYSWKQAVTMIIYQAEAARTCGMPVTPVTFLAWRTRYNEKMAQKKAMEDEEKFRALTPKEREEYKKHATRLSGMTNIYKMNL